MLLKELKLMLMNKVKIIVDSTVDLTKDLYEKYDIDVLPLNINFGEKTYKDGVDIDIYALFEKVKTIGILPHTSSCSPAIFIECFKKYIDKGMDIIFLGLSSTLSSTFQNAIIAKNEFPDDRIYVIDSKSLSSGTGLLVLKAAKLVEEGKSAKEIADDIEKSVPNVVAQFTIEELEYLHKGGRCSGASKIFGHVFHIRPYIKVVDGEMIVYKKPRGSMKIAVNEQLQDVKDSLENIDKNVLIITHSLVNDELLEYTKKSEHREQFRDRLALLLPLFCDKIAEKIVDSPELLEKAVSGELVLQLIDIDIADDGFWSVIGEKVAPGVCSAICHAVESMSEGEFTQFFSGNRQIADVVERTIINMKLLDFYQMLDDVMAEHLGAIQVFGFILGAAIGYLQYAVFLAGNNCAFVAVMLLAIPVFLVLAVKIVLIVPICR